LLKQAEVLLLMQLFQSAFQLKWNKILHPNKIHEKELR
jgi:hypothetical protein